jgi:predicted dinucleotide-binding enzyme
MRIGILGTGSVGRTLAGKLSELGNTVSIGTRNIESTLDKAAFLEWHKNFPSVSLRTFSAAASSSQFIFNCTNGMSSIEALTLAGAENLKGKILIDVSNPLDFSKGMPPTLSVVNDDSLGEQIQRTFPEVKVVKALNTLTASLMVNPLKLTGDHNLFVCGDDANAKSRVIEIFNSFGWRGSQIIDLGDISNARGTEMVLPLWIRLWGSLGTPEFNFHIQRNETVS